MALTRPRAAQVNFDVTNITDPLIRLNSGQSGSNDKDAGIVIERGSDTNVAVIWDESADELAIVNTAEDGSTSGNVTISSYANVRANAYYGDGSNLTGISSSDYGDSDVASYLSANGYGTSSSIIASITDSAPGTLDTLNELAAALGDDANFATTTSTALGNRLRVDTASQSLTGTQQTNALTNLGITATAVELNFLDGVTGITLGTANELLIVGSDGTSIISDSTLSIDTGSNYIGINQSSPEVTLHMTGEGAQTAQIRMEQYNDSADAPDVRTRRYRGTIASPSAIQSGDYLFRSNHEYYNGSALIVGGQFAFDNTNNANRTQFTVAVTTDGTSVEASTNDDVQFKIDGNDSGAITFNNAYKFPTSDGTNGQVLTTNGSGTLSFTSNSVAAGSNQQVQFNNSGALGADDGLTYNSTGGTDSNGLLTAANLDVTGTLSLTGSDISFVDNGGTFPTDSGGFFWDLNDDEARIYAQQPASDDINFYFKLSDNNHADDKFIFWIDDYRGGSYDRYPLVAHGDNVYFNSTETSTGIPDLTTAGVRISDGTIEVRPGNAYDPTGGGTGTDTATDVAVAFPSGSRIAGTNDGYIRTIIEWNSGADIQIGQSGTSLIGGIDLLPGSSGSAKVNGNRILTTADEGTGNGLDADTVDGIQASSFLRSDADDTKTGNIVLQTSAGVESATSGLFFETGGTYNDGRYRTRFRKQDVGGGIPLYIDQSQGSANSYTARARFGTYSGNSYEFEVFGDIKANGNVDVTGVFNGTATSSQYADLAEKYLADADYPIGTVLEIGGDAEVTIASPQSYKIVGTVSEKPGLLMNSGLEGEHVVPVAYIGRVPCRVQGNVNRGDFLVVGNTPGVAVAEHPMNILMGAAIGKALENHDSNDEGIIEILVGRL